MCGSRRILDIGRFGRYGGAPVRFATEILQPIESVVFAPDGATLITGGNDRTARLWNTATGAEIRRFEGHKRGVQSVAFAPNGATLLIGSDDGTARLWDAATGMLEYEIVPLPDSWVVRSANGEIIRSGPNL